jgi:hypothetical protein
MAAAPMGITLLFGGVVIESSSSLALGSSSSSESLDSNRLSDVLTPVFFFGTSP